MSQKKNYKTFYIASKECHRRFLDAGRTYEYLLVNGLVPASEEEADLIVVYTCGGFNDWETRSIRAAKEASEKKGDVIISGCLNQINPDAFKGLKIKNLRHSQMPILDNLIHAKVKFKDVPKVSKVRGVHILNTKTKWQRRFLEFEPRIRYVKKIVKRVLTKKPESAYKLEIARGCLGNCTYCAIKFAMGDLRSRKISDIKLEFNKAIKTHKRIELIAGDIGCYGIDIDTSLPELLKELLSAKGDYKLVLTDINPTYFVKFKKTLIPLLVKHQERIEKVMIPVQSGSNKILKAMKRMYDIKDVKNALLKLKREAPGIKLETHLLVGFPGESEHDFELSKEFIEKIGFDDYFFYSYDDRPRTQACDMFPKISDKVKKQRINVLNAAFG